MVLEAVVYSQDPIFNHCFKDNLFSSSSFPFDFSSYFPNPNFNSVDNSPSPEVCDVDRSFAGDETPAPAPGGGGGRRKRRRRSGKNKEEVENQRRTHIAVERNRRKQMNEYLAVIRSLMHPSYVHRGDQASIIGGAINYVKELEHLLQSLHSQNHSLHPPPPQPPTTTDKDADGEEHQIFEDLFRHPQYSTRHSNNNNIEAKSCSSGAAGEIEVNMVERHANVKILSEKRPKQLLLLVAGFQGLRLSVLHLNVTTTVDLMVLYSFSLLVEEGCQLSTVDDIAAAANHLLTQIQHQTTATTTSHEDQFTLALDDNNSSPVSPRGSCQSRV